MDKLIEKYLTLNYKDLMQIKAVKENQLKTFKENYDSSINKNQKLKEKGRKLDFQLEKKPKFQASITSNINEIQNDKDIIINEYKQFDEIWMESLPVFKDISLLTKKAEKICEDKALEENLIKDEMDKKLNDLKSQIKSAQTELNMKRESLQSTQGVENSKLAALGIIQEERIQKEKILEKLRKEDFDTMLKDVQLKDENLNKQLCDLSKKYETLMMTLRKMETDEKNLTTEPNNLSQKLMIAQKKNEKLRNDLTSIKEFLTKETFSMSANISKQMVRENFDIAKVLRDNLSKNDDLTKQIEKLKEEHVQRDTMRQQMEKKFNEMTETIRELEENIMAENAIKETSEKLKQELLQNISTKKENVACLNLKIKEKVDQVNKAKSRNSINFKNKKSKTKMNNFQRQESSSSDKTNFSGDLSSSISGSKADIANIIANLSSGLENETESTSTESKDPVSSN